MQQVTNNVAHDLRSPLTRLRNRLEVTLLEDRSDDEYRNTIESSISEADGMIHTFNAMLSIARLEAGLDKTEWEYVAMGDLAAELAELYSAVSEEAELHFEERIVSNPIFYGNRHLLAQAITNLLDNAIKYTRVNGLVGLYVSGDDNEFTVTIRDNGPGIPQHERERVLQRFVRLENERKSPGNGLGLSLVQAVARMHGAELRLTDNHPGLIATLGFRSRAINQAAA
ncbi:MAG: HAMP domain-containing sensor histidine kinase [Pseudomonadota bacterium]